MTPLVGPPIHLAYVRHLLDGAAAHGLSRDAVLAEAGVGRLEPGSVTPMLFVRLARVVTAHLDDEGTGLYARRRPVGTQEVGCRFACHAQSLLEAYQRLVQFEQVLDDGLAHQLQVQGDVVVHEVQPTAPLLNELPLETALVMAHRFVEWLGATRVPIHRVAMRYPRPDHARSYRALFVGAVVTFDAPGCRLELPRDVLERSVKRSEAQVVAWARRAPLDALLPTPGRDGVALRVLSVLERGLREAGAAPSLPEVAGELGFTVRALRRRLAREEESFRELRRLARRDLAIRLLTTTERSVEAVAFEVGFTSASAFVRSFRAWTGLPPGAYRRSAV